MVLERDFIVRLIQQAMQFIAAALKLRASDREAEAQEKLNEACLLLVGVDLAAAAKLSAENLFTLLKSPKHGVTLASVLRHGGHRKSAFMLYDFLDGKHLLDDPARAELAELLNEIA